MDHDGCSVAISCCQCQAIQHRRLQISLGASACLSMKHVSRVLLSCFTAPVRLRKPQTTHDSSELAQAARLTQPISYTSLGSSEDAFLGHSGLGSPAIIFKTLFLIQDSQSTCQNQPLPFPVSRRGVHPVRSRVGSRSGVRRSLMGSRRLATWLFLLGKC